MYSKPLASFITFTTYGSWLHGDERGSIMTKNGSTKLLQKRTGLERYHKNKLLHPPLTLSTTQRKIVLDSVIEVCNIRKYILFAAHIRSNHVHILVDTDKAKVMTDFKMWATKRLREAEYNLPKVWTRGGSKKYIFKQEQLHKKADYIINQQGKMMAYYINPKLPIEPNKSPAT